MVIEFRARFITRGLVM